MSTDPKDHAAREVEALAKELWKEYAATCKASHWDAEWILDSTRDGFRSAARFVLAREARLVAAMEHLIRSVREHTRPKSSGCSGECPLCRDAANGAEAALAAHRLATAPSEPTLEEAVEAMSDALKSGHLVDVDGTTCVLVPRSAYNGAMNALARERERATGGRK